MLPQQCPEENTCVLFSFSPTYLSLIPQLSFTEVNKIDFSHSMLASMPVQPEASVECPPDSGFGITGQAVICGGYNT